MKNLERKSMLADAHATLDSTELAVFRTRVCEQHRNGKCKNSDRCPHSHCQTWQRRNPNEYVYSPKLCPEIEFVKRNNKMSLVRRCSRGRGCCFAHSKEEELYHPSIYKTKMCHSQPRCARYYCPFAHSIEELRKLEQDRHTIAISMENVDTLEREISNTLEVSSDECNGCNSTKSSLLNMVVNDIALQQPSKNNIQTSNSKNKTFNNLLEIRRTTEMRDDVFDPHTDICKLTSFDGEESIIIPWNKIQETSPSRMLTNNNNNNNNSKHFVANPLLRDTTTDSIKHEKHAIGHNLRTTTCYSTTEENMCDTESFLQRRDNKKNLQQHYYYRPESPMSSSTAASTVASPVLASLSPASRNTVSSSSSWSTNNINMKTLRRHSTYNNGGVGMQQHISQQDNTNKTFHPIYTERLEQIKDFTSPIINLNEGVSPSSFSSDTCINKEFDFLSSSSIDHHHHHHRYYENNNNGASTTPSYCGSCYQTNSISPRHRRDMYGLDIIHHHHHQEPKLMDQNEYNCQFNDNTTLLKDIEQTLSVRCTNKNNNNNISDTSFDFQEKINPTTKVAEQNNQLHVKQHYCPPIRNHIMCSIPTYKNNIITNETQDVVANNNNNNNNNNDIYDAGSNKNNNIFQVFANNTTTPATTTTADQTLVTQLLDALHQTALKCQDITLDDYNNHNRIQETSPPPPNLMDFSCNNNYFNNNSNNDCCYCRCCYYSNSVNNSTSKKCLQHNCNNDKKIFNTLNNFYYTNNNEESISHSHSSVLTSSQSNNNLQLLTTAAALSEEDHNTLLLSDSILSTMNFQNIEEQKQFLKEKKNLGLLNEFECPSKYNPSDSYYNTNQKHSIPKILNEMELFTGYKENHHHIHNNNNNNNNNSRLLFSNLYNEDNLITLLKPQQQQQQGHYFNENSIENIYQNRNTNTLLLNQQELQNISSFLKNNSYEEESTTTTHKKNQLNHPSFINTVIDDTASSFHNQNIMNPNCSSSFHIQNFHSNDIIQNIAHHHSCSLPQSIIHHNNNHNLLSSSTAVSPFLKKIDSNEIHRNNKHPIMYHSNPHYNNNMNFNDFDEHHSNFDNEILNSSSSLFNFNLQCPNTIVGPEETSSLYSSIPLNNNNDVHHMLSSSSSSSFFPSRITSTLLKTKPEVTEIDDMITTKQFYNENNNNNDETTLINPMIVNNNNNNNTTFESTSLLMTLSQQQQNDNNNNNNGYEYNDNNNNFYTLPNYKILNTGF